MLYLYFPPVFTILLRSKIDETTNFLSINNDIIFDWKLGFLLIMQCKVTFIFTWIICTFVQIELSHASTSHSSGKTSSTSVIFTTINLSKIFQFLSTIHCFFPSKNFLFSSFSCKSGRIIWFYSSTKLISQNSTQGLQRGRNCKFAMDKFCSFLWKL